MNYNFTQSQITSRNTIFIPNNRLDFEDLKQLAEQRAESYEIDNVSRHYKGLIGESAVSKAYGVDLDREIYEYGDSGFDLTLEIQGTNKKVDVKTTSRDTPSLRVRSSGSKSCQIYMCCSILSHGIEIIGWISADHALSMDYWCRVDGQCVFEIPIEDLNRPPIHPMKYNLSNMSRSPNHS
jgi:hypothetical protein